ncbi:MAG: DsbA family protein [Actinomycetota bacterium]|nr:DsbA family protein [Actinomycetota bacterium]
MTTATEEKVDFYFDPACPWTYLASRWIRRVSAVKGVGVRYLPFSLLIKNRPLGIPDAYRAGMEYGLGVLRIVAAMSDALEPEQANQITGELYARIGDAYHQQGLGRSFDYLPVLEELGVEKFADAASDQGWDVPIEKSMERAMEMAGEDVGVPIVAIEAAGTTQGFFGPILCRIPGDEEAVELYEHFAGLAKLGCFFELKRKKASGPNFG